MASKMWIFLGSDEPQKAFAPFIIASGVLVENLVFFSVIAVLYPEIKFSAIDVRNTIVEIVLALCTGPFILMFISYLHKTWEEMFQDLAEDGRNFFLWRRKDSPSNAL